MRALEKFEVSFAVKGDIVVFVFLIACQHHLEGFILGRVTMESREVGELLIDIDAFEPDRSSRKSRY